MMKTDLLDILGGCLVILFGIMFVASLFSTVLYIIVKTIVLALK